MNKRNSALARRFAGAVSGVALSVALSGGAFAQATAPTAEDEVEVVVVTGIRAAIENAIRTKRNLDVIGESVSSEDIGKLPDTSIAESIARLPGLASERVDGRPQRISIRGVGPNFTTTLLNGREQVSTNDSRGVEYDQYPSELLNGVNVYKTTQSNLAAQGIAGTVDMRTVRPLAYGRRALVVGGKYQINSLGQVMPDVEANGYRLNGAYIDQFMDGKLGVAFGVAHSFNPSSAERTEAYETGSALSSSNGTPILSANGKQLLSPGGLKVNASTTVVTRTGLMGVIDFKPTDNLSISLEAYYSTFLSEQNNRGVEVNLLQSNGRTGWLPSSIKETNGYVTEGTFGGRYAIRNIYNENDATVQALGFHTDYDLSEATRLSFDFGYSAAERDTQFIETQPCFKAANSADCSTSSIGYSQTSDGKVRLTIADNLADASRVVLADPYGWGAQGFIKKPTINDELQTYRFDIKHDLSGDMGVKSVEFGVNYTDRRKERTFREGFLRTANATAPIPASLIAGTVNLGFGGLGNAIVFNPLDAISSGALKQEIGNEWWQGQNDWNVEEQITTLFFKANVDTNFAGVPVTGNFGLQYVNTEQSSDGFWVGYFFANGGNDGGISPVSASVSYGEVLPSLNLAIEPTDDFFVKVGLGRVLSRPNMEDMRITRQINFNADNINSIDPNRSPYTGDGGNPNLRPFISLNADLSFEKYFAKNKGAMSLAFFQKNFENYVVPNGDRYLLDLSGFPSPSWIRDSAGNVIKPKIQTALVSVPGNGQGGYFRGMEFAIKAPLSMLSESLEGFGVDFNISLNESSVPTPDRKIGFGQIDSLSKRVANLAVYYEKDGFQARVNGSNRSRFLQPIVNYASQVEYRVAAPATYVDAQLGYTFQSESALDGLSVILQARNITNQPWETAYFEPYRALNYDNYGTTYELSVSYKF